MASDQDAAARRIMDQFGETTRLPYFDIEEGDMAVVFAFPVIGLFVAGLTGIDSLGLPLVAAGFGVGVAVVFVSPSDISAWTWLTDVGRYVKRPQVTFSAREDDAAAADRNEGGLANYTPFAPDERTQDLTGIERAWPGAGAIQRTDDTMEAFVELTPGNMDFAMSEDWAQLQEIGEDFANKELDAKLKFHATTRSFPVAGITETIEERLTDEDVSENPIFQELLEEYRETRPREMRERGIQQLRYYIGVEVSPLDVYDLHRDEGTPAEKLTEIPVIGFLFNPFVTRREDLSEAERRAKMFEQLDERINEVRAEFVQQAPGWAARRLSTVELVVLAMDFWNGHEHEYGDADRVVRNQPIARDGRREDEYDA